MLRTLAAVVAVLFSACEPAPTVAMPKGGPRGLRGSEHLDVAHQDDALARTEGTMPERRDRGPGSVDYTTPNLPWARSWSTSDDHARMAQTHRSEAAAIQAEFDEACGDRAVADIAVSPLQRFGVGGTNTERGVVVYLSPAAGPPDRLMADLRCHRAWMMLAPPTGMDDCPLDLPDLQVDAHGDVDGVTVTIVARTKLVGELQRRAAHELEAAAHRTNR